MKDFFEAFLARVTNPVFGYITFSWLIVNWKPIAVLFFAEGDIFERIELFENATNLLCLVVWPLVFGVIAAIVAPWVKFVFLQIAKYPTQLKNTLQASIEYKRKDAELDHEEKLQKKKHLIETQVVKHRQELDKELNKIEDEELKSKAKQDIGDTSYNMSRMPSKEIREIYKLSERLEKPKEINTDNYSEMLEASINDISSLKQQLMDTSEVNTKSDLDYVTMIHELGMIEKSLLVISQEKDNEKGEIDVLSLANNLLTRLPTVARSLRKRIERDYEILSFEPSPFRSIAVG